MSYEPIPPITPPLGRGGMSNYRHDTIHEKILENSGEINRVHERTRQKGIHKLMRSGTRLGNFVKLFYRIIWDVTYR